MVLRVKKVQKSGRDAAPVLVPGSFAEFEQPKDSPKDSLFSRGCMLMRARGLFFVWKAASEKRVQRIFTGIGYFFTGLGETGFFRRQSEN